MAETSEIDLQAVLDSVLERVLKHMGPGKVATYIRLLHGSHRINWPSPSLV